MAFYKNNIGDKLVVTHCKKISINQTFPITREKFTEEDYKRGWVWVAPNYPVV